MSEVEPQPGPDSSDAGDESTALQIFESFLTRYHEAGDGTLVDFGQLCAEHPGHAALFQKWWDHLVLSGEVSCPGEADPLAELPVEGSSFGQYTIIRELGRGSQGTVFLAEDTRLSRRVALKVLPAYRGRGRDRAERFAREAELVSRLDHPGLCTVYERGLMGSVAFLAMRFVEGETLAACIARARRRAEVEQVDAAIRFARTADVTRAEALAAILQSFEDAARALHAAHEAGLIHRDVKPGNIVVGPRGDPVILDFGLARDVDSDLLTITGDLLGTPAYMSPEQLAAHRIELDRRTDVYSLGATLYECLTLHRPFEAATRNELYQQILVAEPTLPRQHNREIPRDLEVVLLIALDKDRNRRYQTAAAFAEDLRRVRTLEPIHARPAGPVLRLRRWAQRRPGVAASLAAIFFLLAAGLSLSQYLYKRASHYQDAFEKLADQGYLDNAREAWEQLKPITFARQAEVEAWMAEHGRVLQERLPMHRRDLAELRRAAVAPDAAELGRRREATPMHRRILGLRREMATFEANLHRMQVEVVASAVEDHIGRLRQQAEALEAELATWRPFEFANSRDAAVHAALEALVEGLEAFVAPGGELGAAERHLRSMRRPRPAGFAQAWTDARAQAREIYDKDLPVQLDLMPLGKNPQGLLEFADLRSGTVPERRTDGELRVDGGTAVVFVLLAGGDFTMGRSRIRHKNAFERSLAEVQLDWFFAAKHELSRGQWRRLTGTEPPGSKLLAAAGCAGDEFPIESVTWTESQDLVRELGWALPTEAQWEYAALGGQMGPSWFGTAVAAMDPGENVQDRTAATAWGRARVPRYDDGFELVAPGHALRPNPFGLHHALGNVAEWCREWFMPARLDDIPKEPGSGFHHVPRSFLRAVRGGHFRNTIQEAAAGRRRGKLPDAAHAAVGLRPVRIVRAR